MGTASENVRLITDKADFCMGSKNVEAVEAAVSLQTVYSKCRGFSLRSTSIDSVHACGKNICPNLLYVWHFYQLARNLDRFNAVVLKMGTIVFPVVILKCI